MQWLLIFVVIILATKLAGEAAVKLGQPSVLGKLLAGILIGPAVLNWVQPNEVLTLFSDIGVLLLMFLAGLETNVTQLRQGWKSACAVAVGGVLAPLLGGYGLAQLLGMEQSVSLYIGLLLSATSVSITVSTLKELNTLHSKEGSTILGAAVVDDILVVILLAVMMSMLGAAPDVSLSLLIMKKVVFFAVIIAAGWLMVPFILKIMSIFRVTEPVMSAALIIGFAFSWFAEKMGVSGIIGAFAAGLAMSQTPFKTVIEQKANPIAYSLFVPVFFVSIGLNISFEGLGGQIVFVVLMTLVAAASKLIGGGLGAKLTGFTYRQSIRVGTGMISRGEVALILAASGLSSNLLPHTLFTATVMVILLTTLVTPPLLKLVFAKQEKTKAQA